MGERGLAAAFLLSSRARQPCCFRLGKELRSIPVCLRSTNYRRHGGADVSGGSRTPSAKKIALIGVGATAVWNLSSIALCNQLWPGDCPALSLRRDSPLGISCNVRDCGNYRFSCRNFAAHSRSGYYAGDFHRRLMLCIWISSPAVYDAGGPKHGPHGMGKQRHSKTTDRAGRSQASTVTVVWAEYFGFRNDGTLKRQQKCEKARQRSKIAAFTF